MRVQTMSQLPDAQMAQVKARSWMPGSPRKAADWMIPLLIVSVITRGVSLSLQVRPHGETPGHGGRLDRARAGLTGSARTNRDGTCEVTACINVSNRLGLKKAKAERELHGNEDLPTNSMTAAPKTACFIVSDLLATDVAQLFAASFYGPGVSCEP
jgi:hypothetical protein